jgi:hypothetical protein
MTATARITVGIVLVTAAIVGCDERSAKSFPNLADTESFRVKDRKAGWNAWINREGAGGISLGAPRNGKHSAARCSPGSLNFEKFHALFTAAMRKSSGSHEPAVMVTFTLRGTNSGNALLVEDRKLAFEFFQAVLEAVDESDEISGDAKRHMAPLLQADAAAAKRGQQK